MKRTIILSAIAFLILYSFSSCKKNKIPIGHLSVTLIDSSNNYLNNIPVALIPGSEYKNSLFSKNVSLDTTQSNGDVRFDNLEEGLYKLWSSDFKVNNTKYSFSEDIEIFGGRTTSLDINPMSYKGNINLQIISLHEQGIDMSGYKLSLVLNSDVEELNINLDNLSDIIPHIKSSTYTNDNGKALFTQVPYGYYNTLIQKDQHIELDPTFLIVDNNSGVGYYVIYLQLNE